jgi:hypothetical protein
LQISKEVELRRDMPIFYDLKATPDIIRPSSTNTTISFKTGSVSLGLPIRNASLKVYTETNILVITLIDNATYTTAGSYSATWDGTGITENGIFKYEITGWAGRPEGGTFNISSSGIIKAIKPDTLVTTAPNLTVYSSQNAVNIDETPDLSVDAAYALRSISTLLPSTYPVGSFYDIEAQGPLTPPIILAFNYPANLSPYNLKLFKYDLTATPPSWIAIDNRYVIDQINHILYAEVDSLSLFVLMASEDTVQPIIQDLILTTNILNFSITDDLSGINIPSVRIILDGTDVTGQLTINGAMGDLTVSVSGVNLFEPSIEPHTLTIIAQDRGGNEVSKTLSFTTGSVDVKVVIKPEALNINPGILTCYVKLPDYFGVPVALNATLDGGALDKWMIDYDGVSDEGLEGPVVVLKFRRQDIANALAEKGEALDTEFILKGTFDDGTAPEGMSYQFEGSDSVTKIVNEEPEPTSGLPAEAPAQTGSSGKGNKK